jgi:hypothetical protein
MNATSFYQAIMASPSMLGDQLVDALVELFDRVEELEQNIIAIQPKEVEK